MVNQTAGRTVRKGELSDGARALRKKGSQGDIARRCGTTQACVSHWMNGVYRPDHRSRVALLRFYEIPVDAWDRTSAPAPPRVA